MHKGGDSKKKAAVVGRVIIGVLEKVHGERDKYKEEAICQKEKVEEKKQQLKRTKADKLRYMLFTVGSGTYAVLSTVVTIYLALQENKADAFYCGYNSTGY